MKKNTQRSLQKLNIIAGTFHSVLALGILYFSNSFSLPVTATYLAGPPGSAFTDPVVLFSVRIGYAVALFLALSATFHFIVASKTFFKRYIGGLHNKINVFRWVEYSISSTLMILLIAQITGISNYGALLAIAGANASMILFGWLQEKYESPGSGGWLPFIFGCIAGIVPWLVVLIAVLSPGSPSSATPPAFVYGIIVSIFVLFNSFALIQYKQYKAKGKWKDYLRGERAYVILSFTAKAALAIQIFANTLIPN
ncbi:MAG: heliorhodopsin HeR [Candidatus Saccharibacteria bacterium]|nr:heliorhodopsin HeR [Candidatus Saccharibacteria bacterium]